MKKKFLFIFLIGVLIVCLTGCGKNPDIVCVRTLSLTNYSGEMKVEAYLKNEVIDYYNMTTTFNDVEFTRKICEETKKYDNGNKVICNQYSVITEVHDANFIGITKTSFMAEFEKQGYNCK